MFVPRRTNYFVDVYKIDADINEHFIYSYCMNTTENNVNWGPLSIYSLQTGLTITPNFYLKGIAPQFSSFKPPISKLHSVFQIQSESLMTLYLLVLLVLLLHPSLFAW